jgi:hypothetical protein
MLRPSIRQSQGKNFTQSSKVAFAGEPDYIQPAGPPGRQQKNFHE